MPQAAPGYVHRVPMFSIPNVLVTRWQHVQACLFYPNRYLSCFAVGSIW